MSLNAKQTAYHDHMDYLQILDESQHSVTLQQKDTIVRPPSELSFAGICRLCAASTNAKTFSYLDTQFVACIFSYSGKLSSDCMLVIRPEIVESNSADVCGINLEG